MLLIVFLWFFTDHQGYKINYNPIMVESILPGLPDKNNKVKW